MSTISSLPALAFPSPRGLLFLVPLLAQALLLHPRIPESISRSLRLFLILPTVWLAASAPFNYVIEPRAASIGANFRIGIFGPYFILKALEFGLANDRSPYTWIGVISVGKKVEEASVAETEGFAKTGYQEIGKTHEGMVRKSERKEMHHSVGEMLIWAVHLVSSMRGIGYAFGPPEYTLDVERPRLAPGRFLRGALWRIGVASVLSTGMLLVVVARQSLRVAILQYIIPLSSTSPVLHFISNVASYFAVGFGLWANMNIGAEVVSIVSLTIIQSLRFLLPPTSRLRPHPFNSLDYPALFVSPYWPDRGVAMFWRKNWHSLFRRTFTEIGYWPVAKLFGTLFGKDAGKIAGVFSVFALSGWLHHQAIVSATYTLPCPSLPFFTAYGAPMFFLAQAFAVLCESYFMRWTGKRLNGIGAVCWTYAVVVGFGCWAARSWIALGLVEGLPQPEEWAWQRFIIPNAALLPPPLWTVPASF